MHSVLLELAATQKLALVGPWLLLPPQKHNQVYREKDSCFPHLPDPCQGLPWVTSDRERGGEQGGEAYSAGFLPLATEKKVMEEECGAEGATDTM